ncbi:MAG: tRNA (adenosine(37)-N6)-threonylcarbamoyltransferase complex transferase subunit TsaD [Patescibacteria group bacterium]
MKILAIDTSCDDTSVAVTEDIKILSNIISSQDDIHTIWGGVVPNLARNAHKENIDNCIKTALKRAKTEISEIDFFAVTVGPGLAIALEVGINKARDLAKFYKKPLIAVNHMVGHFMSAFAENKNFSFSNFLEKNTLEDKFPILGILVSGGHTELVWSESLLQFKVLGETLDDAIGESFDKVSRMLGLGGLYGGKNIQELAKKGDPTSFKFPVPMEKSGDLNFSYSGLKTAVLYTLQTMTEEERKKNLANLCASFQEVAVKSVILKLKKVLQTYKPKSVVLGGGVGQNVLLKNEIRKVLKSFNLKLSIPFSNKLFSDNAGMIGIVAYFMAQKKFFVKNLDKLERVPRLSIEKNVF